MKIHFDSGIFGKICNDTCGQCLKNEFCHHVNDSCLNGCQSDYLAINCTEDGNRIWQMLIRIDKLFLFFFISRRLKPFLFHKYVTITVERLTDSDGCMTCSVYLKLHCTIFAFTRDLGLFTLIRRIALINALAC